MYRIIKGTFIIAREGLGPYTPDGDTIRFQADNPQLIASLPQRGDSPGNPASIRFEAIDALEKDQEAAGAKASRDRMFELLGLGQESLSLGANGFRVNAARLGEQRGSIIANALDKYGRVIAFVIPGEHPRADGTLIDPTPADIQTSVNRTLIAEGLVYPTFYSTLAATLRNSLAQDVKMARENENGNSLWPRAVGIQGSPATIRSSSDLEDIVLFPTLHRRLDDYLESYSNFDNFAGWVRSDNERRNKTVRILADDTYTDLPGILQMNGHQIGLLHHPENFIFVDGPPTVVPEPVVPVVPEQVVAGDIVIVGVLANAIGPERGAEVVTLLNTTENTLNLAGCTLHDNAGEEILTEIIEAGRTLRIVPQSLQLNNQADSVELRSPTGELIDRVEWIGGTTEGRTMVFPWPRE